jgi:hypothetical protein
MMLKAVRAGRVNSSVMLLSPSVTKEYNPLRAVTIDPSTGI